MKKNSRLVKQKFNHLRWISVDSTDKGLFSTLIQSPREEKIKEKFDPFLENVDDVLKKYNLTENSVKNERSSESIVPKSSRFLKKSPGKRYYCPYYISPNQWNSMSNAPEYDEHIETERINNFYYHMHDSKIDPNPFTYKSVSKSTEIKKIPDAFAGLPPIEKYKQ